MLSEINLRSKIKLLYDMGDTAEAQKWMKLLEKNKNSNLESP